MDGTLTFRPYLTVHEGKLAEFKEVLPIIHSKIDAQAEKVQCYGFSFDETRNQYFCRESYDDAEGFLRHGEDVKEPSATSKPLRNMELIELHGPADELAKLRETYQPLGCRFYVTDSGSKVFGSTARGAEGPDTLLELVPCFKVAEGKMEEFKAGFQDFYTAMDPEAEKAAYYGFGVDEETGRVVCREAYKDADGLLKHLANVDAQLKKALSLSELERLELHGPEHELAKLREALAPLGCRFYVLEPSARRWM